MKKKFIFTSLLIVFCVSFYNTHAQTSAPVDPAWRTGTLSNGMKYYIRKNATPSGKASFWIAHNIGSLHEIHSQNGLAHFLEHMAFNGLKNFPGKSMLEYMQSIGCAFGGNINASTGQTLTQYMLTDVPISREGVIDTCLLILHDWSGNILCKPEELDAERGVIREEWRTGSNAMRRSSQEQGRTLYSGTPYATRTVIGDTSIINNFTQKDILDFYHDWYRPNLQAVVIVGDFDINLIENKVKNLFSQLNNPEKIKIKEEFNVPDNIEPITNVYKDPELMQSSVSLYIKFPAMFRSTNRNTEEAIRYDMVTEYISSILNTRLNEAQQSPKTKFQRASVGIRRFAGDRDAFSLSVSTRNNELAAGFDEALTIIEQARRFGVSSSELERVKINSLQRYESNYAERNNKIHNDYNRLAYSNFQDNRPLMSEEQSLNLAKKLSTGIKVDELNDMLKKIIVFGPNTIIYASGPDKADVIIPDDEMLSIIMYGVAKKQLSPYEDVALDKQLINKPIKSGKVTKETQNAAMGTIEWTLSNGAKVVIKSTPFKQDEISLTGFSFGGNSTLSSTDWEATRGNIITSGISEFNPTALSRILTGKRANVSTSISELNQSISGKCSPKDLETMLQLAYLNFTEPRFDKDDFNVTLKRMRDNLRSQSSDPATALRDSLNNLLNNNSPRASALTENDLDKLNFQKMQEVYKQRFANPGAFTFIFVGNIDLKSAKPLIEKYLGGLTGNKKENYKDNNLYPVKGEVKRHIKRPMQTTKATVNVTYSGEIAYSPENAMAINYLSRILRLRYTTEIREKRGGSYGTSVRGALSVLPKERYNINISFDTDPKMLDELVGVVHDEIKKIAENGPLTEDFQVSGSNMKSQFEQSQKDNTYWNSILYNYYYSGKDSHNTWQKAFSKTDAKAIQELAKYILKQKNMIEVVLLPE